MLIAAIAAMCITVCLGLWLSAVILINEAPSRKTPPVALVHGLAGSVTVVLLLLALQGPRRGVQTGAGGFGWTGFVMLALALAGGLTILTLQLRRRGAPTLLIAFHAMLGIGGAIMMSAWWASPVSYAH